MRAPAKAAVLAAVPSVTAPPSPKANHEKEREKEKTQDRQTEKAPAHRRGRPSQEDRARTLTATKPWEAEGISQRTWYRRQHGKPR
jgi:hypothetical protein